MTGIACANGATGGDLPQALPRGDPRCARVVHLLCHDGQGADTAWRRFLIDAVAASPVTWHGAPAHEGVQVALGLTHAGLQMQGDLPRHVRRVLHERAPAFCEGAAPRAAARLGDTGASASRHWDAAFAPATLWGVITLMHHDAAVLERRQAALQRIADACGVRLAPLPGGLIGAPPGQQGQWVHFGLRDGLSRVALREPGAPAAAGTVALGEVLLGLPRENGDNPWQLARQPERTRALFRHGSFGVLRRIEQHVADFERFVQQQAQVLRRQWPAGAEEPSDWAGYVKAKLCGRWPDGRAFAGPPWLEPGGDAAHPPPALDAAADPQGHGCPFGAHVRRMHPRGTGDPSADPVHARVRVLVRCSRPYGSAAWGGQGDEQGDGQDVEQGDEHGDEHGDGQGDGQERGLLGHFFCASLEDQFEHLLGQWADGVPLGLPDRGDAKDPLIGQHADPGTRFEVPRPGAGPAWLSGFTPFVRTRGTAYAFYPGREGLRLLLSDRDLVDPDDLEPRP